MDNSLVCQTSVIDLIGTLQHALETNNVSCKLLSFCSVVETKVEGYLLSLHILCHCKIQLHLWNVDSGVERCFHVLILGVFF